MSMWHGVRVKVYIYLHSPRAILHFPLVIYFVNEQPINLPTIEDN